jgi:hypothetical protein
VTRPHGPRLVDYVKPFPGVKLLVPFLARVFYIDPAMETIVVAAIGQIQGTFQGKSQQSVSNLPARKINIGHEAIIAKDPAECKPFQSYIPFDIGPP